MNKTTRSVIETMTEIHQNPHTSFEYWIMLGSIFQSPIAQNSEPIEA